MTLDSPIANVHGNINVSLMCISTSIPRIMSCLVCHICYQKLMNTCILTNKGHAYYLHAIPNLSLVSHLKGLDRDAPLLPPLFNIYGEYIIGTSLMAGVVV